MNLWATRAGLTPLEARHRLGELLVTVRGPEGDLAGVSTAQRARIHQSGPEHFFLRMFFKPESRGIHGLADHTLELAFRVLADRNTSPESPAGVILITENPKLHTRRAIEAFRRRRWQHLGRGPRNREWFGRRFDHSPCEDGILP